MRSLLPFALILAACGASPTPDAAAPEAPAAAADATHAATWRHFGAEFTTAEPTTTLAAVLEDPAAFTGQTIHVEGRIADVCQQAGCWLVLAEGERTIRITTKNHDYGVDRDVASLRAELEGVVLARPLDPERTAHHRSESANPDAMPEDQAGEVYYEIDAAAVRVHENS
jgi:hypothetical protein